ncbi:Nucleoid occlusion protein [subsurface metagenome]
MTNGKQDSRRPSSGFKSLDMACIIAPEGNVRMDIAERELFELSESMKEVGLIHPIVVAEQDGKYEVVVGQRRWLAAKKLGWSRIRAEVRTLDGTQIALIRANENLQREGLTPIEEAGVYADLFDTHSFTIKMIAKQMGKSVAHVRQRMDLLKMDEQVQMAVHKGDISAAVARELHKIEDKKDLYRYLEMAIQSGITAQG